MYSNSRSSFFNFRFLFLVPLIFLHCKASRAGWKEVTYSLEAYAHKTPGDGESVDVKKFMIPRVPKHEYISTSYETTSSNGNSNRFDCVYHPHEKSIELSVHCPRHHESFLLF